MAMIQRPKIFVEHTGIRAAMTLRGTHRPPYGYNFSLGVGDDEAIVLAHRATLASQLGFAPARLATQHQVHGDVVAVVREGYEPGKSDALIASEPGWLLAVSVADCAPVLIYDPIAGVVAGVHSGWRGTAADIVGKTVGELRHLYESQPEDLIVYVGPAAGACCYEVGDDVADRFPRRHSREIGGGKYLFDNRGAVLQQLLDAGVHPSHIGMDARCTICDGRLHSYRRDGPASGRMFAVIGLVG
jgi:YfiH family protein